MMKRILGSALLMGSLSVWSVAQKPQTTVQVLRPSTVVESGRPQTSVQTIRPVTTVGVNHPVTQVEVVHPQTEVAVLHPSTTVAVIHPQTNVEVVHPQTREIAKSTNATGPGAFAVTKGVQGKGSSSAQVATSMSDFKPKQAKDFMAAQKAASVGGGENTLGNQTNVSEKDAANKASSLSKQGNQNMEIDPNLKTGNLAAINAAVEKKVEEKVTGKTKK